MLGLEGSGLYLSIAHRMQLVGHQRQHAFSISLRGIATFPALFAELFQFMVQAFPCFFSSVSVSGLLSAMAVQARLRDTALWDTTPSMT